MNKRNIANPRQLVDNELADTRIKNIKMRIVAIALLLAATVYLVLPFDFDDGIKGRIDDFMFFMSAFCFVYAQFMGINTVRAIVILKLLSAIFCFLGALWLIILFFM